MHQPVAYSYVRFSTPEQAAGDSLDRQTKAARDWSEARGIPLDIQMTDRGVSGFTGANRDHGALRTFLARIDDGTIPRGSYLIVESLDRLSRQELTKALPRFLDIINAGVTIVTLLDGHEYSEQSLKRHPFSLFESLIIMYRAHEESEVKSKRGSSVWAKKKLAAADGRLVTRRLPGWLELARGSDNNLKIQTRADRAATVKEIFQMAAGGMGRAAIVRHLNARGIEPFRETKKGWQESVVQKLLTNPAVMGIYQPHTRKPPIDPTTGEPLQRLGGAKRRRADGEPIPGYFPVVVDELTFLKVQKAMAQRRTGGGRKGRTYANALGGLCRCGKCGGIMTYQDKGRKGGAARLVCNAYTRRAGCDHGYRYRYKSIENSVLFGLRVDRLRALSVGEDTRRAEAEAALVLAEQEHAEADRKRDRLLKLFVSAENDDLEPSVQAARQEAAAAKAAADRLRQEIQMLVPGETPERRFEMLRAFYTGIQTLEGDALYRARADLHQRLKGMIKRIEVKDGKGTITYADGEAASFSCYPASIQ